MRRALKWRFIIADVKYAILGADFFHNFKLSINISKQRIDDTSTGLYSQGNCRNVSSLYLISSVSSTNKKLSELLDNFIESPPCKSTSSINIKHFIPTTGAPCHYKPRPLALRHQEPVKQALEQMLQDGIIRHSRSNWSSPLHIVPKKPDTWRILGDYRDLNSSTKKDTYSLPYLQDFSAHLHGKKIFSRLDLKHAFWQVDINEDDIPKTCIATPFGNYEFIKMPYGLSGASQTFQRYINQVLWNLQTSTAAPRRVTFFSYIDDILIASDNDEDHEEDLKAVFQRLSDNALKLNPIKCKLGVSSLEFLGHHISTDGISPLTDKVESINNFTKPLKTKGLRCFLGMINYYRRFIPHAAKHLSTLFDLVNRHSKTKNETLVWDETTNSAFINAKNLLASQTLLVHPIPDSYLSLTTDASDVAVGAVLHQTVDNIKKPLAFYSHKLSRTQQKYSTFGRELLAMYLSIKHFRRYIEGRNCTFLTDHKPILGAFLKPERDISREVRQLQYISQFSTDIRHVSGTNNQVADALSRSFSEEDYAADAQSSSPADGSLHLNAVLYSSIEEELVSAQQNDNELNSILDGTYKISVELTKRNQLYGDNSNSIFKPFVPSPMRHRIFNEIHNVSHAGAKSTLKSIRARFFWPEMNKQIKRLSLNCIMCQRCKITRHNKPPVHKIETVGQKFSQINVDIVGPLNSCREYRYILTIIDRYSRWTEAIPITNTTAETVADALLYHWIARYGVPVTITSDRGSNFESHLFQSLVSRLGSVKIRTTAYHPQGNAIIERFHRRLKEALKATSTSSLDWVQRLPLILLSLRTSIRDDNQPSPADILYGTNLRLPVDLLERQDDIILDPMQYTDRLVRHMQTVGPIVTRTPSNSSYLDPHLQHCKYVFVKNEGKKGLNPVYSGPFLVLEKKDKYFKVQLSNRVDTITISRIKAAHTENDVFTALEQQPQPVPIPMTVNQPPVIATPEHDTAVVGTSLPPPPVATNTSNAQPRRGLSTTNVPNSDNIQTRSGRRVRLPVRFNN